MNVSLFIALISMSIIIIGFILFVITSSSLLSKKRAEESIDRLIKKSIGKSHITKTIVLVESPAHEISQTFVAGKNNGHTYR